MIQSNRYRHLVRSQGARVTRDLTRVPGFLAALGMTMALSLSCKGIEQAYPNKKLYAINAGPSTNPSGSAAEARGALRVRPVAVASPYDGVPFMYKVGESRFESDYYNNFVTSPRRLLTGEMVRRLGECGLFSTVTDAASIASSSLAMELNVTSLYGDYTNRASPAAVIEARAFLIKDEPTSDSVLFQKSYRVQEPCAADSPDALVAAWGKGYGKILDELISDLRRVNLSP